MHKDFSTPLILLDMLNLIASGQIKKLVRAKKEVPLPRPNWLELCIPLEQYPILDTLSGPGAAAVSIWKALQPDATQYTYDTLRAIASAFFPQEFSEITSAINGMPTELGSPVKEQLKKLF